MKQVAEDAIAGRCSDGTYYVSRSWYDWKRCWILFFILQHMLESTDILILPVVPVV